MGRRLAGAALCAMLIGAAPVPASAATVEVRTELAAWPRTHQVLVYTAAPGEANQVRVTEDKTRVADDGAQLSPGEGCTAISAHEVTCSKPEVVRFALGDGDDTFAGPGSVDAGPGNDRLSVAGGSAFDGEGDDVVEGSAQFELIYAGPGNDQVRAGGGDDQVIDHSPAGETDLFDGGPGRDYLAYSHTDPITVDLRSPTPNGRAGENDTIVSAERIASTFGPSTLIGGPAGEGFSAGRGPATIEAGGGPDEISVNTDTPSRVAAGDGDDSIQLEGDGSSPIAHELSCGRGSDFVLDPNPGAIVPDDCERVRYDGGPSFQLALPLRRLGDAFVRGHSARCGRTCRRPRLVARRAGPEGRPVGRPLASRTGRGTRTIALGLNAYGRRLLARRHSVDAVVLLEGVPDNGGSGFLVRLRAPR